MQATVDAVRRPLFAAVLAVLALLCATASAAADTGGGGAAAPPPADEQPAPKPAPTGGTVVVKRGANGCVVRRGSKAREYPAEPATVVDATGAGDAFAAGFLAGGPELAVRTAARCVSQMGAMP